MRNIRLSSGRNRMSGVTMYVYRLNASTATCLILGAASYPAVYVEYRISQDPATFQIIAHCHRFSMVQQIGTLPHLCATVVTSTAPILNQRSVCNMREKNERSQSTAYHAGHPVARGCQATLVAKEPSICCGKMQRRINPCVHCIPMAFPQELIRRRVESHHGILVED